MQMQWLSAASKLSTKQMFWKSQEQFLGGGSSNNSATSTP
jgi:hypothetical protein